MQLFWVLLAILIAHAISVQSANNTDIDNASLSLAPDATTAVEGPIIGILTRELSKFLASKYPMYDSFIAASYVKYLESSGARVVPIFIGRKKPYYEDIMNKINGVLFPGGSSSFKTSSGYADAGDIIYKIAKSLNDKGQYFPLWGTCLGFELLVYLAANRKDFRASCNSINQPLPLNFKPDYQLSKMFKDSPSDITTKLSTQDITSNFHSFCVTEADLKTNNLDKDWTVIAINNDLNGFNFISAIESKKYPFYGVQFHPEKVMFEWQPNKNIPRGNDAILGNRYFGDFFVSEARKSNHKFASTKDEQNYLIYKYKTEYTDLKGIAYEQCYFF
ncbi:gamma-glutamyl hydrolase A-like [Arctopsyche grandis]|uniref:gamma-glutamyl hydrolase A-like n=1 Tax=Arctopsyche grandis TaxID=121162 RepID=UPI00406D8A8D